MWREIIFYIDLSDLAGWCEYIVINTLILY